MFKGLPFNDKKQFLSCICFKLKGGWPALGHNVIKLSERLAALLLKGLGATLRMLSIFMNNYF